MQLPHRFTEIVQFPLVLDFLSLGEFQSLQQLVQFFDHVLQGFDDAVNVLHGLGNGGALPAWFRWRRQRAGFARGAVFWQPRSGGLRGWLGRAIYR